MNTLKLIVLGSLTYSFMKDVTVNAQRIQFVSLMSESLFVQVCQELLSLPKYEDYSMKPNSPSKDPKIYDVQLLPERFIDRVKARRCPSEPDLFLSDGTNPHSVFAYYPIEKGLLRFQQIFKLTSLGYRENVSDCPRTPLRHVESVSLMHESKFLKLCEEILTSDEFSKYSLSIQSKITGPEEFDVYLPPGGSTCTDKVKARGCPTEPELFLSDGLFDYSVFVYNFTDTGLVRIDRVDKLTSLGFAESNLRVPEKSLLVMDEYEFLKTCDEIRNLAEFKDEYSSKAQVTRTDPFDYDVYTSDEDDIVERVKARICPTEPPLILSDGPEEFSAFVYKFTEKGLIRIVMVDKLTSLGYEAGTARSIFLV